MQAEEARPVLREQIDQQPKELSARSQKRYIKAWQAQVPNITLPLSTAETRHYIAASGRGDYGRT
eukprot:3312984-Pleurochrysis_carterae.AAC.2